MTLDTRIYVHGPVDYKQVFAKGCSLIGATEATRCDDRQDKTWRDGTWEVRPDSPWTIMTEPGQGLDGWLMVHYRPGAALRTPEQSAEHDEDCKGEDDCSWNHREPCWLEISLDTAYSYSGERGGCGDLHAWFVAEVGHWLDERGVPWGWLNEFTGEKHQRYEGLDELGNAGDEARAWFTGTVVPMIAGGFNG